MAINFNTFNGKNEFLDYQDFELGIKAALAPTCLSGEIFLFNNFPIDVSTEISADFVLILAIEDKQSNYLQLKKGGRNVYVHNLIIPVKVVTAYENAKISINGGVFTSEGEVIDYTEELPSLGFGMKDYLVTKCKFEKDGLFVHPLIFVLNNEKGVAEGHLIYNKFSFEALMYYFSKSEQSIFISYRTWKTPLGFGLIDQDIKRLVEQASLDSKTGYITQKKVDRISRELSEERGIFEELNKKLIIIEGKAGTGKTSEIILSMMRCVDAGQNTMFLTFNKLLVYDISKTIKSYVLQNKYTSEIKRGEHSVLTLHKFMHKLSRSIGLLHLMSDKRVNEIIQKLIDRSASIEIFISSFFLNKKVTLIDYRSLNDLKTSIQQSNFDRGTKEVGIDVANFIKKGRYYESSTISQTISDFVRYKSDLLAKIEGDRIFISDYYEVLKDTLLAINNPKEYFEKYNVSSKYDLLEIVMKLSDKDIEEGSIDNKIDENAFLLNVKGRITRRKRKRVLFVDEAQDCHPTEREILFGIFGTRNVVVGSGGYEQLIRHVELCRWNFYKGKKLIGSPSARKISKSSGEGNLNQFLMFSPDDVLTNEGIIDEQKETDEVIWFKKGRRSFRVKKAILDFCNHLGKTCNLELGLQALNSEDVGEVIFDFRNDPSPGLVKVEIDKLMRNASLNGCTAYEGLLMLIDAKAKKQSDGLDDDKLQFGNKLTATINEYDNIEESLSRPKKEWRYSSALVEGDMLIWDGAVDDKNEIGLPSPTESRLLYYESCRGLEAWNVACFDLDRFFSHKYDHPDAEKFLIETERESGMQRLEVSNEMRKRMFAGTWALMALTRAMNKIYIGINDSESEMGQIALDYIKTNPKNVTVLI